MNKDNFEKIPPDIILYVGKFNAAFGYEDKREKIKKIIKNAIILDEDFFVKNISFSVEKLKSSTISLESIVKIFKNIKVKEKILLMCLDDQNKDMINIEDLRYIKKFIISSNCSQNLKKRFNDISLLENQQKSRIKNGDYNFFISLQENKNLQYNYAGDKNFLNYIKEIKNIINNEGFDYIPEYEKIVTKKIENEGLDFNKINEIAINEGLNKSRVLSNNQELFQLLSIRKNILIKKNKIEEVNIFFEGLNIEDFYNNLDKDLTQYKRNAVSRLIYNGYKGYYNNTGILIGEIENYIRKKNDIKNYKKFSELPIENSIIDFYLRSPILDVRNKMAHGIFDEDTYELNCFLIYICSILCFYSNIE